MQLGSLDFFILFSSSFILTSAFTPAMRLIALRLGITDKPIQSHKTHSEPVPYLGGIAIVLGSIVVTYGSALLTNFTEQTFLLASTIILPAIMMASIGLVDDIYQLRPWPRFIAQNILASFAASILVTTNTLGTPSGLLFIDFAVTVIWLVGITNSINFFDNIDGGASGTIAISSVALSVIALSNGQVLIAAMSTVLSGSTIGFLLWNKPPARIYMGDAGALFLGILIATLTIRLDSREELGKLGLFVPIFLLAIPILDTSVAVIKRILRGISPFQGGRDHLSHRLMRLGLRKQSAVLTLWIASAVFSILAFLISKNIFNMASDIIILGALLWISLFVFFLSTQDEN